MEFFELYIKIYVSLSGIQYNLFERSSFYSFYVTRNQTAQVFFGTPGIFKNLVEEDCI
jgi:hypothetical protein